MEILIPNYEQKKLDKKRTSITIRLNQVQASAISQIFWKSEERGNSFSKILRVALSEHLKNKYNINIPADLGSVDE